MPLLVPFLPARSGIHDQLNPRSGDGWYALHRLAVPASRANIERVVVTPAGVFVVDSKDWSDRLSAAQDTLWVGRYPNSRELGTLGWETASLTSALARDQLGSVPVAGPRL